MAVVGRPNVGKSTLVNALAGTKVAIVSAHPQTTRRAVSAVLELPVGRLVLVDTPGLHRPRTPLGERLNARARAGVAVADAVAFCLPADGALGPGDRFIAAELADPALGPVTAVVTKADAVDRARLAAAMSAAAGLGEWAAVLAVSARTGRGLRRLVRQLSAQLPPAGPGDSPPGSRAGAPGGRSGGNVVPVEAGRPEQIADLIREAAILPARDELPHSIAVVVDELIDEPGAAVVVHASLYVERPGQRGIVLGARGTRLRDVGTAARREIERLVGRPVYLDLAVKVAPNWQRDPRQLRRLGV